MIRTPKVSVIITTYNRYKLLDRAINSVLLQTYRNMEIVIVDDNSSDNTESIIKKYMEKDNRINFIKHKENMGLSAARNTGFKNSIGELIAYLDDDDEWLPEKLEQQVNKMLDSSEKNLGLIYCWMNYYKGKEIVRERHTKLKGNIFEYSLDRQPIGNGSTWLICRSVLEDIGGFDERLPRGIDGDFIRRMSIKNYSVDYVPKVLIRYYVEHGKQRITRSDNQGLINALYCENDKLQKFKCELDRYSKQKSNIYSNIAYIYSQLGDKGKFSKFTLKAIKIKFHNKSIYLNFFRGLKNFI
ncbi:MAG: glycosyltransferase family 2 protein [bacterium]